MATLPSKREDLVQWCQTHAALWTTAPTAIGLTAAQVLAFKNLATLAADKVAALDLARSTALAATKTADGVADELRTEASDLVQAIRSYAANTDNTSVYQTAQIPPPAPRGTVPPPGRPTDFKTTINPGGTLTLDWKCKNPAGGTVIYRVERQLPSETTLALLDVTGDKFYTDETLPFGVDEVVYKVTAQRGTVFGPSSQIIQVRFGSLPGGGRAVRSVSTAAEATTTATTERKKKSA